jgi:hypothetical protein
MAKFYCVTWTDSSGQHTEILSPTGIVILLADRLGEASHVIDLRITATNERPNE